MSKQIKIDDGLMVYDVVNQNGTKIGEFSFNPYDTGLAKRFVEVLTNIKTMKINFENNDDNLAGFIELQKEVEAQMKYLLGNESANVFFDVMGAFSLLPSGELYIEHIVSIIGKLLKDEAAKRKRVTEKTSATLFYHYLLRFHDFSCGDA